MSFILSNVFRDRRLRNCFLNLSKNSCAIVLTTRDIFSLSNYSINFQANNRSFNSRKTVEKNYSTFDLGRAENIYRGQHSKSQMSTTNQNQTTTTKIQDSISEHEAKLRLKYKPRECRFKNPYGHIAGLEWGKPGAPKKILCIHGWLDNAGSFERLIPCFLDYGNNNEKYHIVAIDLPGVGHSSHIPRGTNYTQISGIMEMRRVTLQLKWERIILLAHSLGAHLSFLYSCIYNEQVESFITIDLAHPITRQVEGWNVALSNSIEEHFKCEDQYDDDPATNIKVPVYSEVDVLKRLMVGHSNSLTRESAEVLLKRGAKKQRWGYTFTRDIRLRHTSLELKPDDSLMLQNLDQPFCPNLFIIRANQSPYNRPEEIRLKYYELYKRNCPMFRDVTLDGTHHVHMNSPELVAPEMNKFLLDVESDIQARLTRSNL